MNALDYLLRFPWVEPLGRTLIHFLWQGALVGGAAWMLLRLTRRCSPTLRHAVAACALALCAVCPVGTFLWLAHPWRAAAKSSGVAPTTTVVVNSATPPPQVPMAVALMPTAQLPASPSPSPVSGHDPARGTTFSISPDLRTAAVRWAVLLWTAGVIALGGRLCVGWTRVQCWRGRARPIDDARLAGRFRALAEQLGIRADRARLLVSRAAALPGPLAMGILRPVVLLPARVLERLPLAQIEALLAHELAHIRRHDYLWNLLASALEVALFYHPAVWLLGRELCAAREECCDALAAEVCPDRVTYARALAAVAECRATAMMIVPAPAAARSPLVARVRRLLGLDVPPEPLLTGRNAGWSLALAAVALAAMGILHSGKIMAQNDDEQDPTIPILVRPAPHGSVVDAAGHPVPGARVRLVHIRDEWNPDNGLADETTADAAGGFVLTKPLRFHHPDAVRNRSEYTLLADVPNLAPAWVTLSPDDAPDPERQLMLTPPGRKSFVVTDRAGKPVSGAVVELSGAYPREGDTRTVFRDTLFLPGTVSLRRAVTDDAGQATVEGLPDTTVQFATSKEGFGDFTAFYTQLAEPPQKIVLQVSSILEGRVTDPLGRPVSGAMVSLYPKFRFHTYFVAKTDADGRYRVDKIWSDREANSNSKDWGKYEVSVRHPGFTAASREVGFDGQQTITRFDFAAVPGTELVGHLLDPQTRAPVVDACVQVDSPSGRQTFFTGTDGGFHGRIMPGKIYAFFSQPPRNRFVVDGYVEGLPHNLQTQADGERFPIDLYLPSALGRLGTVRGQVNQADGSPAARCQVVASMPGRLQVGGWRSDALRGVTTDAAGRFAIKNFPIGVDFSLNARAEHNTGTATLPVRLEGDAFDLPAPVVLQPTSPGGELLLTDRHGKPCANLSVEIGPVRDDQRYPVQSEPLRSDAAGILRVPHFVSGTRYAVVLTGADNVTRVVNAFDVPAAGAEPPSRRTLVIDKEGVLRLLGEEGQAIPVKRVVSYEADTVLDGKRTRWTNDLPVTKREGPDAIIPWDKLVGMRGDMAHFLIETDDGTYVRAEGPAPLDGSNLYVIRVNAVAQPDSEPDPMITDVAADSLAGRVVTQEGAPVAGAVIDLPGVHLQDEKAPTILSGADGVFRVPRPTIRSGYLTVAKEGWATAFVTDPQAGHGFRVTLRRDTRLRGTVGGEDPGRVALVLKTNKFTRSDRYHDHEVQDVSLRLTTDKHGEYDFPVEPGRYRWAASSADGRFASGEVNVAPGRSTDLGASLHRGYDVTFELKDCQCRASRLPSSSSGPTAFMRPAKAACAPATPTDASAGRTCRPARNISCVPTWKKDNPSQGLSNPRTRAGGARTSRATRSAWTTPGSCRPGNTFPGGSMWTCGPTFRRFASSWNAGSKSPVGSSTRTARVRRASVCRRSRYVATI